MATKKQTREAALAKREVWLAELAEENLIALAKNRAPDGVRPRALVGGATVWTAARINGAASSSRTNI